MTPGGSDGEIVVYETNHLGGENGKFRCMKFSDGDVQGAMDLKDPGRVVLGYQRALAVLIEANAEKAERIYIVGHGIGTLASRFRDREVRVAEIDPAVAELSRTHFGYDGDNVRIGDGRSLLAEEADRYWDVVVLDAFTSKGMPAGLTSLAFLRMAANKLRPGGTLFANAIGRPGNGREIGALCTTFGEAFPHSRVYGSLTEKANETRNFLLAGSDRPLGFETARVPGFREIEAPQGHIIRG